MDRPPRRPCLQFSVRSLLILMLAVAAFCAGMLLQRALERRRALPAPGGRDTAMAPESQTRRNVILVKAAVQQLVQRTREKRAAENAALLDE